jgi:hypothetical protein
MRLLTVLIILVACTTVHLKAETAERMVSACRSIDDGTVIDDDHISFVKTFDSGLCWGAFASMQTAFNTVDTAHSDTPPFYVCLPSGTSRSQLIKFFVAFMKRHPERLNEDFFFAVRDALKEVFPCKK